MLIPQAACHTVAVTDEGSSRLAQDWAREISPKDFWFRIHELDRQVIRDLPDYEAAVDEIVNGYRPQVRDEGREFDARTRQTDPAIAGLRSGRRVVGVVVGVIGIVCAYAFFFSRADFGAVDILPWSSVFLAAGTGGILMALLPVQRSAPTTGSLLLSSWLLAGFAAAAAAGPLIRLRHWDYSWIPAAARTSIVVNLVLAGVCVALSLVVTVVWLRGGREQARDIRRRIKDVSTQREAVAGSVMSRSRTGLEDLHRGLAAAERESLARAYHAAGEILVARGLIGGEDQVTSHVPGMLMLQSAGGGTIHDRTFLLVPQLVPPRH